MSNPFYELRMYRIERGRMADMRNRWHNNLAPLFRRHGIVPLGGWQATSGPKLPLFIYLMHWPDWATRQSAWASFYADPQWAEARTRTNEGSELVEGYDLNFLTEILPWQAPANVPCIELWLPEVDVGRGALARASLQAELTGIVENAGGMILSAMEFLTGENLPKVAVLLGWPNSNGAMPVNALLERAPLGRAVRYQLNSI